MSLKRLALLAAVAYHNQPSQQNQQHEQQKQQQQQQHSKHTDQSTPNATTLIETQVSTNMGNSNNTSSGNNNNSTSNNNNSSSSHNSNITSNNTSTSSNNNNSTNNNSNVTSTFATAQRNIRPHDHNSLSSTNLNAVVRPHLRKTTTTMRTPSPAIAGAMVNADNEKSNNNEDDVDNDVKANDISDLSDNDGPANDGDDDDQDEEGDMDDSDDAIQDHIRYHQQHHQQTGQTYTTYYTGGIGLFHQQNIRAGNMGSSGATGGSLGGLGGVGSGSNTYPGTINGNVNLLLGGAMLSLVTTILCVVCYCCHRNIKKRTEAAYRQQRQWLENDANMEIYSVEQCYETSGLFLGESSDGLATLPPLHHEPPPSYDAVVAMQEQQLLLQQQQQLQQHQLHLQQLQRNSPPPGYRSSLDVSIIVATAAASTAAPYHRGAPDGMASSVGSIVGPSVSPASDSNGNLCQPLQAPKHLTVAGRSLVAHPILNMKRVLNAQSCCSLQRAEVENMFNAAAAAVAARNAHAHVGGGDTPASGLSNSRPTTPAMRPRKSLPSRLPARSAAAAGGRYQQHQQGLYRRGCPLCGKFRYDGDDDDDEDDDEDADAIMAHATTDHPLDCCWQERVDRADQSNGNVTPRRRYENDPEAGTSHRARSSIHASDHTGHPSEACSCDRSASVELRDDYEREDRENGNSQWQERPPRLPSARSRVMDDEGYAVLDAATPPSQRELKVATPLVDSNANEQSEEAARALEPSSGDATTPAELPQALTTSSSVDLDTINENGIIRLDMSKIIDKTGLPTYEAALKLESSGYV